MRHLAIVFSVSMLAVPAAVILPAESAEAQSRYYRNGYYSGPTWRDSQGRVRCRRGNGTVGLIVGGAAGALVGREIDRRRRCR